MMDGSAAPRPVLPLPGPLDQDPTTVLVRMAAPRAAAVGQLVDSTDPGRQVARQMLTTAVAGLPRGMWDEQILRWLAGRDVSLVATVASLLRRAWQAGIATGRAERVEEHQAVQEMRTLLAALTGELEDARRETRQAEDDLRERDTELGEVLAERDRLSIALRAIEDAAAGCRAGEPLPADTALTTLLTVIATAAGGAR